MCHFFPNRVLAICPPSSCQAGSKFKNVIKNPSHAANKSGVINTSWPSPPFPNINRVIVIKSGSPLSHSINLTFSESPSIISLSITGAVYAPYIETITVIIKPAIGPAIATSYKISRLIVSPFAWINAPNVGIPKYGMPGIKYGQVVFSLWNFAATRWPDSCTPKIPKSDNV